jgi:hypothetical protein
MISKSASVGAGSIPPFFGLATHVRLYPSVGGSFRADRVGSFQSTVDGDQRDSRVGAAHKPPLFNRR